MIKCLLLLPRNYNDGSPVESGKLESCYSRVDALIGGHTVDGDCEGVYRMADGSYARDTCVKVWAVCDSEALPALRALAGDFAIELRQESIYFEQTATTVEFVKGQ